MRYLATLLLALLLAPPLAAQSFERGYAAAERGDFWAALREWRPLAEAGDRRAQRALGNMYDGGWGVRQDFVAAAKWFRMAAEQGDREAQYNLGALYRLGLGVTQDHLRAQTWFHIAAALGDDAARIARDTAAANLTPARIAEAQRRARAWLEEHRK